MIKKMGNDVIGIRGKRPLIVLSDIDSEGRYVNRFKGNILSSKEKIYRMNCLKKEINLNNVDFEFIDYLKEINSFNFIATTQCCSGHKRNSDLDIPKSKPFFDFRSGLSEKTTIKLLRKLADVVDINIELKLEGERLRYLVSFNEDWKKGIEIFIKILQNHCINFNEEKIKGVSI